MISPVLCKGCGRADVKFASTTVNGKVYQRRTCVDCVSLQRAGHYQKHKRRINAAGLAGRQAWRKRHPGYDKLWLLRKVLK